jgi:hypothetical protein
MDYKADSYGRALHPTVTKLEHALHHTSDVLDAPTCVSAPFAGSNWSESAPGPVNVNSICGPSCTPPHRFLVRAVGQVVDAPWPADGALLCMPQHTSCTPPHTLPQLCTNPPPSHPLHTPSHLCLLSVRSCSCRTSCQSTVTCRWPMTSSARTYTACACSCRRCAARATTQSHSQHRPTGNTNR